MRVGLDVDGVLCDHVLGIEAWIERRYGIRFEKRDVVDWDYDFGPSTLVQELKYAYSHPTLLASLPSVRGARRAVQTLLGLCQVVAVTNRPESTRSVTTEWLRRSIGSLGLVMVEGSKANVDVDLLVDDYPPNVREFASGHKIAVLFDQPWNRKVSLDPPHGDGKVLRARGWSNTIRIIRAWTAKENVGQAGTGVDQ